MKKFKFLNNDDESIEEWDGATWMWYMEAPPARAMFHIVEIETNGIREFLGMFPNHMIVLVDRIVGPNGIIHDGTNTGIGWGFDITSDPITVKYLEFYGENI
jgi:hypothetical protein